MADLLPPDAIAALPPQPQPTDVVLGGGAPESAVLGGLEGLCWRLRQMTVEDCRKTLPRLLTYGVAGSKALIPWLQHPDRSVQQTTYQLLRDRRSDPGVQVALSQTCPFPFFETLATLPHPQGITALAFNPSQSLLVSACRNGQMIVWDLAVNEPRFELSCHDFVYTLTVLADRQAVVAWGSDRRPWVWSLRNGQPLDPATISFDAQPASVDVAQTYVAQPRGINQLESQGWLDDAIAWQPPSMATSPSLTHHSARPPLRPKTLASVVRHGDRFLISCSQNTVRIWDLSQGRELGVLRGHTSLVSAVAVAGDRLIATGSEDKTVRLWGIP